MNVETPLLPVKKSFALRLKEKFLFALRLTDEPRVKLYNGYGNRSHCIVYGHVFSFGPEPRRRYRRNFISNTLALLRLFMVKPVKGALLQFTWEGKTYTSRSAADGFFRFEWPLEKPLAPGWYQVEVQWMHERKKKVVSTGSALVTIPYEGEFTFISDIDDTFLVSYSANLRKRLYVLLTENARSRRPFEGVVNHYQLLSGSGNSADRSTFFYVSSSEWNLYDYIGEFSEINHLPKGVFLLNQLKLFSQVFKTGQNNHKTKFMRISRILEAFPEQRVVLLGDDSQEDPFIYAAIASHFKSLVHAVYIRQTAKHLKPLVEEKLKEMESMGVSYCYFLHSAEAILHSKKIGLISEQDHLSSPIKTILP